jgi:hypothetical protein
MNAYVRVRLALTEDWPTIKLYDEARWAELADARTLPVEASLALLDSLHSRWVALLESLGEPDWQRGYLHPESGKQPLGFVVLLYDWHSRHHTAHVTELRKRMAWWTPAVCRIEHISNLRSGSIIRPYAHHHQ